MPEKYNDGASVIIKKCHVAIGVTGDNPEIVDEVLDDCLAELDKLAEPEIGAE